MLQMWLLASESGAASRVNIIDMLLSHAIDLGGQLWINPHFERIIRIIGMLTQTRDDFSVLFTLSLAGGQANVAT